jgi:hypothetical protein
VVGVGAKVETRHASFGDSAPVRRRPPSSSPNAW